MVQYTDILICGSGSAGLMAATYLARCGISSYKVLERRSGPMTLGQADGVQCRTVEIYESFGIAEEVIREAFHILEVAFWAADEQTKGGGIRRTGRTVDTKPGLSHMPHVILNQARMNGLLLDVTRKFGGPEVEYGWEVKGIQVDKEKVADHGAYCASVTAEKNGKEEIFMAKYVLACDGAHSIIRRSLGFQMVGDSTDSVWGVMDVYPRTNFPDIRKKATLHSESGNLLIIPREGGSLVRFYIELEPGTIPKDVKLDDLQQTARRIFQPYTMDFADTIWWSAYSIGQRVANHFHESHRVFLTGDACHTHSPKAGQGMNVSLQDGYNLAWKLAAVLKGQGTTTLDPSQLLDTYVLERQKVATDLINFDRYFTRLFSSKARQEGVTAKDFSEAFIQSGRFTAGLTATYDDSVLTSAKGSAQHLAGNLIVGMRFPSAQVVRFCDAKAMQLAKALQADGRWRVVIFAGDVVGDAEAGARLKNLADYLSSPTGPVHRLTPSTSDIDSFIEPIVVLTSKHVDLEQEQIPEYFWPTTGKWQMRDLHKVFVDEESYNSGHGRAYEYYQIDPKQGAIVIVRPDQYVSMVVGLDDHEAIGKFFSGLALQLPNGR